MKTKIPSPAEAPYQVWGPLGGPASSNYYTLEKLCDVLARWTRGVPENIPEEGTFTTPLGLVYWKKRKS